MDRQRRSASKITDYRRYHLSGDLEHVVQGKVSGAVELLERTDKSVMENDNIEESSPEELQDLIREQKENSARLQQQVETMRLRNELEAEQMQQKQWELAIERLKQSWDLMAQQYEDNMEKIRNMAQEPAQKPSNQAVTWIKSQLNMGAPSRKPKNREEDPHRLAILE